jgi:hypothetical protein
MKRLRKFFLGLLGVPDFPEDERQKKLFVDPRDLQEEEIRRAWRKNVAFQRLRRMRARKGLPTLSFCVDRRMKENNLLPIVREEDN